MNNYFKINKIWTRMTRVTFKVMIDPAKYDDTGWRISVQDCCGSKYEKKISHTCKQKVAGTA